MSSKALPYQVSAFANAADRFGEARAEAAAFAQRGQTGPAFRSDASSSSNTRTARIEPADAFTAFAQGGATATAFREDEVWQRGAAGKAAAADSRPSLAEARSQIHSGFPTATSDGAALSALLNGDDLTGAVDGDWEHDLRDVHARTRAPAVPTDPLARRSPRTASPTRERGQYGKGGDMSPTSRSLLSTLASLSLAEQTYLRTLLASQDPAQMFDDYFSHGSYTDDVWSMEAQDDDKPAFVRDVLDRATEKGKEKERIDVEDGRAKAVRRLEMVLRHLNGRVDSASSSEDVSAAEREAAASSTSMWAQEAAAASRAEQQARTSTDSRLSTTAYAPSSLSSSAFVSFATSYQTSPPRPAAKIAAEPVANNVSQTYSRPAAPVLNRTNSSASSQHSDDSVRSDSSYEEYAREKEARMRSNEGGRFGPDFTRRFVSAENEVRGGESGVAGGSGSGSRGGAKALVEEVSEGRTH